MGRDITVLPTTAETREYVTRMRVELYNNRTQELQAIVDKLRGEQFDEIDRAYDIYERIEPHTFYCLENRWAQLLTEDTPGHDSFPADGYILPEESEKWIEILDKWIPKNGDKPWVYPAMSLRNYLKFAVEHNLTLTNDYQFPHYFEKE